MQAWALLHLLLHLLEHFYFFERCKQAHHGARGQLLQVGASTAVLRRCIFQCWAQSQAPNNSQLFGPVAYLICSSKHGDRSVGTEQ